MSRTKRSVFLRATLLCLAGAGIVVFSGQSFTHSTSWQQISQELEKPAKQECDVDGPLDALEDCPPETIIALYREKYDLTVVLREGLYWLSFSDEYVNETYRYSVILPDGVEGLSVMPPAPCHGFFIDVANELSRSQDARENRRDFWAALRIRLDVDASYNSADYASADDAADASLGYYKEDHAADLVILNYERTTLRKVPASRCVIQFQDAKSGETTIVEEVITIRAEDGIVFSIGLTTTPARYSEDRKVLKQILKGVRFTKPE